MGTKKKTKRNAEPMLGAVSYEQYMDKRRALMESMKLQRLQAAYGVFLKRNRMNRKDFLAETGLSQHVGTDVLNELTMMGLLDCDIACLEGMTMQWALKSGASLPEGWPSKEMLITMECPKATKRGAKHNVSKTAEKKEDPSADNPLTRMLRKEVHPTEVKGYELMLKAMSQDFLNKELNDLADAVASLCLKRIEQQHIDCPLCKGRLQRNMFELHCTQCGVTVDGGTFEKSMEILKVLAKAGVKV